MARLSNGKRSRKAGLSPGSLIHVGEVKTDKVSISVIAYGPLVYEERDLGSVAECVPYRDSPNVTWINIEGLHRVEVVEEFGRCFNLHPLILEDILTTGQRPKTEDMGEYLYLVLKMISLDKGGEIVVEQVSLVLGPNWVLSFQETPGDVFDPIRRRLKEGKGRHRKMGADYLAYSLIDAVVDNYFAVLERVGERIENVEENLLKTTGAPIVREIHRLRRDLVFLRKSVWPLRDALSGMQRGDSPLIGEPTRIFLRDVYDHTNQVIDSVETYRDMASGMLDIYLSSVSNRMNEIMKVLTIMSTIFIPLTFIAGVYGMNFLHMPELKEKWGYPAVLALMGSVAVGLIFYFRRRKWV